jgi:apolipoprotein N-acyltransferase
VLSVAFPPHDLWLLAVPAVSALALLVEGRRLRAAYGLGVLFGLGFLVPLLTWSRVAGDDGWIVLSVIQALLLGLVGPLGALAWRVRFSPLWIATAWVLQEALRGREPFGGFPWGRLAFVQPADGGVAPVTRLAAIGGAPLVSFAVALAGGLLAAAIRNVLRRRAWTVARTTEARGNAAVTRIARVAGIGGAVLASLAVLAAGWLVPAPVGGEPDPTGAAGGTSATVAAVQGNVPRIGLDWMGQRRAVTRNHLGETEALAGQVAAGTVPAPDLVVWPENSSDLDPFQDPAAAAILSEASEEIGRPILVGAVLRGPGAGHVRNAGLVWGPNGYLGSMYVKRHPVPFGEYLPGRAILERMIGRFASELPDDFLPGRAPGLLPVTGPAGTYRVGDVICFEVAYDGLVRDVADRDARILVVQTNNATFGRTGETYQQLAMSRLRAIEHGRSMVVVATSGVSALITPDGRVVQRSGLYTPDTLVSALPLRSSRTVADRLGPTVEYLLIGLGLLGVGLATAPAVRARIVRRRRVDPPATPESAQSATDSGPATAPASASEAGSRT